MIQSIIYLLMGIVFAGYAIGYLKSGTAQILAKRFERDQNTLVFWALTGLLAVLSIAMGYYGIKGLL